MAGFVAGCMGIFAGHPFDTIKTRMQIDDGKPIFLRNGTLFAAIRDLYRGILPPTLTVGFMASINFFVYEKTRRAMTRPEYRNTGGSFNNNDNQDKPVYQDTIAGAIGGSSGGGGVHGLDGVDIRAVAAGAVVSGLFSSLLSAPISMIKVQQQVVSDQGMIATARALYRQHGGMRVFYRAYPAVLLNETYGRGAYFVMYESSKGWIAQALDQMTVSAPEAFSSSAEHSNPNSSILRREHAINEQHPLTSTLKVRMLAAAVAGVFSWFVIYPMDVIKSKLQIDVNGTKYSNSVVKCFKITWREAGMTGLTRGLGYTLLRAVPVASTVLPIYESVRDVFNEHVL